MGVVRLEGATEPKEGPEGRNYDAILLDLFGTLVDFRSVLYSILHRILVDNDLNDRSDEFISRWQQFVFQGQAGGEFITVREDFIRSLVAVLDHVGIQGDLRTYSEEAIEEMFERLNVAEMFPEVQEVLSTLIEAKIPWAVVSNVDDKDLAALLEHHRLSPTVTVSSERARSYKPDPGPFKMALEELGVSADRVLHVGDSVIADVEGARALGIDCLWVNRYGESYPGDLPDTAWEAADLSVLPGLLLKG
jgi:2-haloacid dehalogenase/putative hydrolase of the HAD superfamily